MAVKIVGSWAPDRATLTTDEVILHLSPLVDAFDELLDLIISDATFENRDVERYKYDAVVDDIINRAAKALNPDAP
jgi:hypothetical protein